VRSRFLLCELALADDTYPKYPPQPVALCEGYQIKSEANSDTSTNPPGQDA
jgi:hypothetical protein